MSAVVPDLRSSRERLERDLTISPADYAALTAIGLPLVYVGLHDGSIRSIRQGQRWRIPSAWVRRQLGIED